MTAANVKAATNRCKQRNIGYYPPDRGVWTSFRAACPKCSREVTVGPDGLLAVHRTAEPKKHEGRIEMILDGPNKGDWIAYCAGCDWRIEPRPLDHTLGEAARAHERQEGNRG